MSANTEVLRQSIREMVHSRKSLMITAGVVGPVDTVPPPYKWGQRIKFGKGGQARPFLQKGWSFDEDGFVWTDGPASTLSMLVPECCADLCIQLRCRAFLPPDLTTQSLKIRVNGHLALALSVAGGEANHEGRLFRHLVSGAKTVTFSFEVDRPVSPAELGIAPDERKLGVALYEITLVSMA